MIRQLSWTSLSVRPEPEELKALKAIMTVLDGKIVYQDQKSKLIPKTGAHFISSSG